MVQILDSTLREGEQTPGVYFDPHIKLAIADMLDKIGIDFIEAGHPAVSKEIEDALKEISMIGLKAVICAHSRSLKKDVDRAIRCGVKFLGVFYCVSDERLNNVFNKKLSRAIDQIVETIRYAKEQKPDLIIRYTPEDTVRSNFKNVIEASVAAVEAGADIISIADTTGYMIPGTERNMYDYILKVKRELADHGLHPKIAVHCHNDRGLALANAIDGYRAGAEIIDASVMGLGERAGIVDLAQLLVLLKTDFNETRKWNLKLLPSLYSLVSKYSRVKIPENFPVLGKNAFTHCAGIHTHAAAHDPVHYQSLDPEIVGRRTEICLDHMAGAASVRYALRKIGEEEDDELVRRVLERVKITGQKGRVIGLKELKYLVNLCKTIERGV